MKIFCLAAIVLLLSPGCSKDNQADPQPGTVTDPGAYQLNTIRYSNAATSDANLLSLDVYSYLTTDVKRPVIIYVHGGGWRVGDKSNSLENKLSLFDSLHYIFVSINYRLSPTPTSTDPGRIMFPVHNNDVADAVKWVADSIIKFGGDRNKIILLGHSAGAQLVSLTGTSQQFLPARGLSLNLIRGIASIDTEGYVVGTQISEDIYQNAFGLDPAVHIQASPSHNLQQGISYPKFFVAKRGTAARIATADSFINKLQLVGVSVNQVNGSIYDHEGINDAIGNPNDVTVTPPLISFFTNCFSE